MYVIWCMRVCARVYAWRQFPIVPHFIGEGAEAETEAMTLALAVNPS